MLEWVEHDATTDKDDFYRLVSIHGHRRKQNRQWEVKVEWASGKILWHNMNTIFRDDPVTLSMYARKHNLLSTDGWRRCKRYAGRQKVLARMANQVRLKNYHNRPRYKYSVQIPRSHEEAILIDEKNGDRKWQDSEDLELSQLWECNTFEALGKGAPIPEGYKKIPCNMVYDCKFDGRRKS